MEMLEPEERDLWTGKPYRAPYVLKRVVNIIFGALFLVSHTGPLVYCTFWDKTYRTGTLIVQAVGVPPLILHCV